MRIHFWEFGELFGVGDQFSRICIDSMIEECIV
jgi:hypothetical protein